MVGIENIVHTNIAAAWVVLAGSFLVLFKCAELFVDNSIAIANWFNVPKLIIGIVLVSLATTAPELSVSLMAALKGNPEMALGNAIGSVICDDGLALALAGTVALSPIVIAPKVLKSAGVFLITIEIITFLFVIFDHTLNRWEGAVLVILFAGYLFLLFRQHTRGTANQTICVSMQAERARHAFARLIILFAVSLAGILFASDCIISSATAVALSFHIPEGVIALTLVAFGTSIPEVATCITAARKGEGSIAVGNILGADIMNICWVAGASAIANDLTLTRKDIVFMFPSMFIIVGAMLALLGRGYTLTRGKGLLLLGLYILYLVSFFMFFPPHVR